MARTAPAHVLPASVAAIVVALVLPFSVAAAQSPASGHGASARLAVASFSFGRSGGNIAPTRVTIGRSGRITATRGIRHVAAIQPDAVAGLLTLARAVRFFSMARNTTCVAGNPDFAGTYVTVATARTTRTVTVRGSCRAGFTQLYAVLSAAAGTG